MSFDGIRYDGLSETIVMMVDGDLTLRMAGAAKMDIECSDNA